MAMPAGLNVSAGEDADRMNVSVAERVTRLLERIGRACVGCRATSGRCIQCVAGDAHAILREMKVARFKLGVVDCDTGLLERRNEHQRMAEARGREKAREKAGKF